MDETNFKKNNTYSDFVASMLPGIGCQYIVPDFNNNNNWFVDAGMNRVFLGRNEKCNPGVASTSAAQPRFYVRPAMIALWHFLDGHDTTSVVGSPGGGKSITCLQYALRRDDNNHRFLFIRNVETVFIMIYFRVKTNQYEVVELPSQIEKIVGFLDMLLNDSQKARAVLQIHTVIMDGFHPNVQKQFFSVMIKYLNIKFCAVSWQSQPVSPNITSNRPIDDHSFPGWTPDDYWAAYQARCFTFPLPFTRASVNERYFYAGRNAGLFATQGTQWAEHIVSVIDKAIDTVSDLETMSLQSVGRSSSQAVNTLFSKDLICDRNLPSSELIARWISKKTGLAFVNAARLYLQGNLSFQGFVTKLEVLILMRTMPEKRFYSFQDPVAARQTVTLAAGASDLAAINAGENFLEASIRSQVAATQSAAPLLTNFETWVSLAPTQYFFDAADLARIHLAGNQYYIPAKWNNACFDGIYLPTRRTAYFFNVTISKRHSFSPLHLLDYVIALGVYNVEMIYICPKHIAATFKLPPHRAYGAAEHWGNRPSAVARRAAFRALFYRLNRHAHLLGPAGQIPSFAVRVLSYEA